MNKTMFFKGGEHRSSMGEGGCHSSREGAVLWEDAVYQGREPFFEGEEMFFNRGSCSLGGQMLFINEG